MHGESQRPHPITLETRRRERHEASRRVLYNIKNQNVSYSKSGRSSTVNILSQFLPVTYNTLGSSETDIPLKTSAPCLLLSCDGHSVEKSSSITVENVKWSAKSDTRHPHGSGKQFVFLTVFFFYLSCLGVNHQQHVLIPHICKHTPSPELDFV